MTQNVFQSFNTQAVSFDNGINLLDIYSVNEFTPELTIDGSSAGITYEMQFGYITCIGNMGMINVGIKLTDMGSETGELSIQNLPFPTSQLCFMACSAFSNINLKNRYSWVSCRIDPGSNVMHLQQCGDNKDIISLDDKDLTNTSSFYVTGAYSI